MATEMKADLFIAKPRRKMKIEVATIICGGHDVIRIGDNRMATHKEPIAFQVFHAMFFSMGVYVLGLLLANGPTRGMEMVYGWAWLLAIFGMWGCFLFGGCLYAFSGKQELPTKFMTFLLLSLVLSLLLSCLMPAIQR